MEGRGHSAGGSSRTSAVGSDGGGAPDGSVTASHLVKVERRLLSLRLLLKTVLFCVCFLSLIKGYTFISVSAKNVSILGL